MVIPSFEYVAVLPDRQGTTFSCEARPSRRLGIDARLGSNLVLHVDDAGPTACPNPRNPATQRSRLRLWAAEGCPATVAELSFLLDRGVISALQRRDVLYLTRSPCGRIGVSAIRSDQLIFAVGAITQVSLGCDFEARVPMDLVREGEAIFQRRDAEFRLAEYPVAIRASDHERIMYRGRMALGAFEVRVLHGFYSGWVPGTDECVSVARKGACPAVDANNSALFLDSDRPRHFLDLDD